MTSVPNTLRAAAHTITGHGLHRGENFMANGRPDLCAALYNAVHGSLPDVFTNDSYAARDLIEASPDTMAAIVAITSTLDTQAPVDQVLDDDGQIVEVTEYVEHLYSWIDRPGLWGTRPPSDIEVIGRLLRLADELDARTTNPLPHAA